MEIQVETSEGMATRTVHMTHLGPVVAGQGTPWTDEYACDPRCEL